MLVIVKLCLRVTGYILLKTSVVSSKELLAP
jgi:hypothetical protein